MSSSAHGKTPATKEKIKTGSRRIAGREGMMYFPEQMNPEDRFHDCTVRMGQVQIRLSANERKEPDHTGILGRNACQTLQQGKK